MRKVVCVFIQPIAKMNNGLLLHMGEIIGLKKTVAQCTQ